MTRQKIAIAMSGGVDSSVAASLLKEEGADLVGFSMQLWDYRRNPPEANENKSFRCCSSEDLYDAREVAARLGFPFYVVDLRREFEATVVKSFVNAYRDGLTPSPCVLCNSLLKFRYLAHKAEEAGCTKIATGHYARVLLDKSSGRLQLLQAVDLDRDQSYFLFELTQEQLAKVRFPLGTLSKAEVRQIARRHGLHVAHKPDSQEICFVPDGDYSSFVERYCAEHIGARPLSRGEIVDSRGNVLGEHSGIHRYTIGQRRGIGIAARHPLYVLEIRPEDNTVVVGERALLGRRRCRVVRPNWISIPTLSGQMRVRAKIRSRHVPAQATISPADGGSVEVVFDAPQPAITPGQACVFYHDEVVVGGGWIDRFTDE